MTQPVYRRALPLIGSLLVALLALSLVASPSAEAAGAPAAPTGFKVLARNHTNAEVAWKRVAHATSYSVVAATDKTMKHVAFRSKTGATYRWISGKKITDGRTYYVQVQAFQGSRAGRKSAVHRVALKAHQVLRPTNVMARPQSTTSMKVSWTKGLYATGYTVKFAARVNSTPVAVKSVGNVASTVVTGINLAKLRLPRTFFVTVTATRYRKTFRDSLPIPAALPVAAAHPTAAGGNTAFTLNVGSYNMRKATLSAPSYPTWSKRAPALGRTVAAMHADVVGLQEANWERGGGPVGQVARAAGMQVAMHPGTSSPCGLDGINLIYNPARLQLSDCGGNQLINATSDCCVTWGLFTKSGGSRVIVADTHLEVGRTASAIKTRVTETSKLVSEINQLEARYSAPAVIVGDLNTNYNQTQTTPMAVLSNGRYLGADLLAASVRNYGAHSAHNFASYLPNAIRIDHIFISPGITTQSFAVDVSNPRTAPSDHFPIQAALTIPAN